MARLSVVLAGVLLVGMIALGLVQTMIDLPDSALAGAAVLEVTPQKEINICMDKCMRGCVVEIDDNDPCLGMCEGSCGVA